MTETIGPATGTEVRVVVDDPATGRPHVGSFPGHTVTVVAPASATEEA